MTIAPAAHLRGEIEVPGDKSISHRYAILSALADGRSHISGYAPGADCSSTLSCLAALGVEIRRGGTELEIDGRGLAGLIAPAGPLDAGNSGTTMRLLAGVLAAHGFEATLVGDASLSRRPMRRVIEPLSRMGASIEAAAGDRPPLGLRPPRDGRLRAIAYELPVPSAQVKSAVLLAGLHAVGTTRVIERVPTRDHTERALRTYGVAVQAEHGTIVLAGGQRLEPRRLSVPGDGSSAAFFGIAAAALPGSDVTIRRVGLNPTRTGWLDVLRRAGAHVAIEALEEVGGEPVGTVRIRHEELGSIEITAAEVPGVIDELPALAALATHGSGIVVTGASELRAKESDRITALGAGLRALGAEYDELPDGFVVRGLTRLRGGIADAAGDHRLAMAFAIAALGADGPTTIAGAEAVAVSYPGFFAALESLRA